MVSQTITLPARPLPTLTLYFDLMTRDHTLDDFAVYVQGNPTPIYIFGTSGAPPTDPSCANTSIYDFGWQFASIPIPSQYEGQTITLVFANESTGDGYYNTWTYLDDVQVTVN
jgi:hypothetical protein